MFEFINGKNISGKDSAVEMIGCVEGVVCSSVELFDTNLGVIGSDVVVKAKDFSDFDIDTSLISVTFWVVETSFLLFDIRDDEIIVGFNVCNK